MRQKFDINAVYQEWLSLQPLCGKKAERLRTRFLVEYNFNSNHIEGNTLTYGQTELLLLFGMVSSEGPLRDFEEMKASNVCLKMVQEEASSPAKLTETFIRQLHKTLLREDYEVHYNLPGGIPSTYTIHAGRYKTRPNSVITRYGDRFEYASPEETPALMGDLVAWYNNVEHSEEYTPVELAALFHYRYIRIHPFEDGNGRMARLMVNFILKRHGWPMIVVRNRNKDLYLDALHQADLRVGSNPSDGALAELSEIGGFLRYFTRLVGEEIQSNIDFVRANSPNMWWYDGQVVTFRSPNTAKMLFAMCQNPGVTYDELREITGINLSAIQRQLALLQRRGYIQRQISSNIWRVFAIPTI